MSVTDVSHVLRYNDGAIHCALQCHSPVIQVTVQWQPYWLCMRVSHAIAQHDVLLGQFQQHWIIKELVDTHILAQTLHRQINK